MIHLTYQRQLTNCIPLNSSPWNGDEWMEWIPYLKRTHLAKSYKNMTLLGKLESTNLDVLVIYITTNLRRKVLKIYNLFFFTSHTSILAEQSLCNALEELISEVMYICNIFTQKVKMTSHIQDNYNSKECYWVAQRKSA